MNGHVERRPGKRGVHWRVLIHVDAAHGGPARKSGGTYATRREAQQRLAEILAEYRHGTWREPCALTVEQLLDRWLSDCAEASVRPTSLDRYRSDATAIALHIGDRQASTLRAADCDRLFSELRRSGRRDGVSGGLSAKSVRCLRGTLLAAYKWAVQGGLLQDNPVERSAVPRLPAAPHEALPLPDVRRVVDATRGHMLEPIVVLAAFTGMRRGELLALSWSDIDLSARAVTVAKQVVYIRGAGTCVVPHTKGGKPRRVALAAEAVDRLAEIRLRRVNECAMRGIPWSDAMLLAHRLDGRPLNPNSAGTTFAALMRTHGLPGVHLHMLRHALATELIHRRKVDVVTVQQMLGHSHPSVTTGMYVSPEFAQQVAAADAIGEAWKADSERIRHQIDTKRRDLRLVNGGGEDKAPA